jgi:hypothetical protein
MNTHFENFIGVFEDAFSKEYCDNVIEYFNSAEKAGLTVDRQQESGTSKLNKDDSQLAAHAEFSLHTTAGLIQKFNDVFWNMAYPEYAKKYAVLLDYAPHTSYAYKIQKTEVGQGYHVWHSETTRRELCTRILAWALYLNDVEEGGETEFLYYPKRIKSKTGTLIIWPAGLTHTHRGNPPISNEK